MNQMLKRFFSIVLLCAVPAVYGAEFAIPKILGKSVFVGRSQGSDVARWMAGYAHHRYFYDTDCINADLQIIGAYGRTFRGHDLAKYFSFNGTPIMNFGPANLGGTASPTTTIFARNFFLNDDFNGNLILNPGVENFVLDINFYLGLDEWIRGLWFEIDIPINWTRWDLRPTTSVITPGTAIAAEALGNTLAQPSPYGGDLLAALNGQTLSLTTFPAIKEPLRYARIDGKHSKAGVADVTLILGYNFWLSEYGHFGVQGAVIVPTGNRPKGEFLFEPVCGNGKHVEVGGGMTASFELWENGCDQSFSVWIEGYAYHVFRARQKRTFDLTANGVGSRYLLLKKFNGATPALYNDEVVFGPNVTTLDCNVENNVHGDGAIMFDYQSAGFTFDVGFNVWGRTKDKIKITGAILPNTFGVQGGTTAFAPTGVGASDNFTQSLTTINGNEEPATPEDPAVTITTASLNPESAAAPNAVSYKVFTHFGYTWENCDYLPYLGVGGEVEFCGNDERSAFNQWGVWVKGGFAFA